MTTCYHSSPQLYRLILCSYCCSPAQTGVVQSEQTSGQSRVVAEYILTITVKDNPE